MVSGVAVQALGALILMALARVGAIWSTVIGVCITSGFTEFPKKISGTGICAWRIILFSDGLCSLTTVHPGSTSINKSPERLRWKPLRIIWISGVHAPNSRRCAE